MDSRNDLPDSVIEEIAAILATGYLRLRKTRSLGESAQATGEQVDGAPAPSLQCGHKATRRERGN